jgi:hypothetical protein
VDKYPSESAKVSETVGFTLEGIPQVMVFVFEPMLVSPVYVVIVNTMLTDVPVVFWLAKVSGGVKEMLVLFDFVLTVPEALPHL